MTTQLAPEMALYVHWPFCKKKCPYCDFNSHVRAEVDQAAWRDGLLAELRYWAARTGPRRLTSIFFGGGTPSLVPPETVAAIIAQATRLFTADASVEITLEANPTSVEAANFAALRAAGVNRVSLGVQSLRAEALRFLGREHNADEALAAIALARDLFPRYSFDLIYALPGQTLPQWERELREALAHARGHLSLYQLTIEPNTAFHHQYHVDRAFALPEESLAADFFATTQAIMTDAGMPAYEISNHAAPGEESRHNLTYWHYGDYLGIGPGAHGRVTLGDARYATATLKSPERWLEQVPRLGHGLEECTALSDDDMASERVLMGMRLVQEGLDLAPLCATWRARIEQRCVFLHQEGLLRRHGDHLIATARGLPVLNAIVSALLR